MSNRKRPRGSPVEVRAAELGEEADRGNGLVDASPAAAGPVEHGPHQRQAGPFAGESADDLHSAAGLAEGAFDQPAKGSGSRWDFDGRLVVEPTEVSVEGFDDALVAGGLAGPAAAFGVVFERADLVELGS